MTTHEKAKPARDDRDYNDAAVRQAVAAEQAKAPVKEGWSSPWGRSTFGGHQHRIPGCMTAGQWAGYLRGDIMSLPYACRVTGHVLPKFPGYTR